ncbi:hypothetical protein GUITHDRAFT_111110 [Guillardia theta CCMP2712]|uniref:Uncharacterized protein n=1 Tax=Guillardia theta (strain CCMP2712) TaxID=905079 RepID=L1J2I9_GUITC|nr:hypothetical protein GUITHDRAFT_111110 [Guillardia theta CCMP2712]EKX42741.1 hypothetical protein GUITHDRAFT_111110 [Guillardia theta CCMP2712]|eukprot:XP_005829721.1 hypothetical protein GUITHDRAFT_111110 [Guillardia theta CCMP2712]
MKRRKNMKRVTRTGLVEANRGFQDHMFKLYTGQSLKQRHIDHASQSIGGSRGVDRFGIPRGGAVIDI